MRSGNLALLDLTEKAFENKRLCSKHFSDDDVKYVSKTGVKFFKDSALPVDYLLTADSPVVTNERVDNAHVVSSIDCNDSTSPFNLLVDLQLPILVKEANPLVINLDERSCSNSQNVLEDELITSTCNDIVHSKMQIELDAAYKKIAFLKEAAGNSKKTMENKFKIQINNYQQFLKSKSKKIENLERKILKYEEEAKAYKDFKKLNQSTLSFFKMQINHIKLKKWTDEEKQFGISLFYKSPKAYCFLRDEKEFALPCVSLIRRWVNELDLQPGKTENLLELLKIKSKNMSCKERECVLIWDEMGIKEWLEYNTKKDFIEGYTDLGELGRLSQLGNHVLVFMLRGRQHNWRQPISYYVSHNSVSGNDLHKLILDMLDYVEESGFQVQTMVCDLGSPNQRAIKQLNISTENPFIERYNRKIFFNFDPPHLMKCLRNALKNHGIKSDNVNVSWGPIIELYEKEKNLPCKSAPKLTYDHVHPRCFDLMNVKLATQIFSNSVSAALLAGHFANCNPLTHPDGVATANFLKKANDVFDCLNSRSPYDKNPLRCPLSDKNDQVVQYLKDSLLWIETWECVGAKNNPPCFRGFTLTITSILMQWDDIKKNNGLYLLTSRLNQDPIENLFAVLRSRGGHTQNPTAMQLRRNLQYTMTANLNSTSKVTNCEPDRTVALLAISGLETETSTDLQNCSSDDPDSVLQLQTPIDSHTASDNDISLNQSCQSNCETCNVNANVEAPFMIDDDIDNYISEVMFPQEVDESIVINENNITPLEETDFETEVPENVEANEEIGSVVSSSNSSLRNLSDKYDQIFINPLDPSTPMQASIKYVAGYVAKKCLSKVNCSACSSLLIREDKNFQKNDDLLIFFKSYACIDNDNELGNLCVPSDDFTSVMQNAIQVFHHQFTVSSHLKNIGKILYEEISKVIQKNNSNFFTVEEPCRVHRQLIIKFFVRVHLFYKLKWMNRGLRDAKKRKRDEIASNKPNRKLQKLNHE